MVAYVFTCHRRLKIFFASFIILTFICCYIVAEFRHVLKEVFSNENDPKVERYEAFNNSMFITLYTQKLESVSEELHGYTSAHSHMNNSLFR